MKHEKILKWSIRVSQAVTSVFISIQMRKIAERDDPKLELTINVEDSNVPNAKYNDTKSVLTKPKIEDDEIICDLRLAAPDQHIKNLNYGNAYLMSSKNIEKLFLDNRTGTVSILNKHKIKRFFLDEDEKNNPNCRHITPQENSKAFLYNSCIQLPGKKQGNCLSSLYKLTSTYPLVSNPLKNDNPFEDLDNRVSEGGDLYDRNGGKELAKKFRGRKVKYIF